MTDVVVSAALGGFERLAELSFPAIAKWARSMSAEFAPLRFRRYPGAIGVWEKLQIRDHLAAGRRVLWIDADVCVRPGAPSILDASPPGKFSAVPECLRQHRGEWNDLAGRLPIAAVWASEHFFNAGVFVVGPEHARLFDDPPELWGYHWGVEQAYLNMKVAELANLRGCHRLDVFHPLDRRFNWVSSFPEEGRGEAWVLHHTGGDVAGKMEAMAESS